MKCLYKLYRLNGLKWCILDFVENALPTADLWCFHGKHNSFNDSALRTHPTITSMASVNKVTSKRIILGQVVSGMI